jgi:cell shape-determining protein MreC
MKSLFLFSVLSVVIILSACSKPSKEEQCKKAMDHFVAVALADASMEVNVIELLQIIERQAKEIEQLKTRIKELEDLLSKGNKNSKNS